MNSKRVLVTGGSGTTGSRTAAALRADGHEVVAVSRSTQPAFDWGDPRTFEGVLAGVAAAYLLPPVGVADPEPQMTAFVRSALEAGVRRFVLLSAAAIPEGSPGVGRVHALLRAEAPEWAVLQPSWFMQNFERNSYVAEDLRAFGLVATSVEDGKIAFVDADDIAAVAARALTDAEPHQTEHILTGPAALSYDEATAILSEVSGRRMTHERVTREAVRQRMERFGLGTVFAEFLSGFEADLRAGAEDRVTDVVQQVTGRPPRDFAAWASAHAAAWR